MQWVVRRYDKLDFFCDAPHVSPPNSFVCMILAPPTTADVQLDTTNHNNNSSDTYIRTTAVLSRMAPSPQPQHASDDIDAAAVLLRFYGVSA